MQRNAVSKVLRQVQSRSYTSKAPRAIRTAAPLTSIPQHYKRLAEDASTNIIKNARPFSTTVSHPKGLSPESENPQPAEREEVVDAALPAELSIEEYTELSDRYMNAIVEELEEMQEEKEGIDVEYSAGVLTLIYPPIGTYVINKQPPNKQIWLSSPTSGPKRYDWVLTSEGQNSKEGTGGGEWVYLRDNSTLRELLLTEVGVDLSTALDPIDE